MGYTNDYPEEWYDDGENDLYLGDPEEDYPYGALDCE